MPTTPAALTVTATEIDALASAEGRVAVILPSDGKLDAAARRVNKLMRGALARLAEADSFAKAEAGTVVTLAYPVGMAAEAVDVLKLDRRADPDAARRAGAALGKLRGATAQLICAGSLKEAEALALGAVLRGYSYTDQKSSEDAKSSGAVTLMVAKPEALEGAAARVAALAEGVFFTRDLVSHPANVLTTTQFAKEAQGLESLGVKVEVLEEDALRELGMHLLLSVGEGSDSPSKVAVMHWDGGEAGAAPLALVGKGVVFDTGGISLKPAAGMEEMTMDMGGAGVVAGVMKTLALRKAKANVVGLIGLVENMPSGRATRPGDVVASMKGDTVEIINTDAEGRLVLADVLWYAQDRFKPSAVVDLATLTGAVIIGLGHENAGVFSNDDKVVSAFLKAAEETGEGAWRLPLGKAYDDQLKSRIADMKNVGGRPAGSITAAQFLQRFIKEETPWIHLDIAGVASVSAETDYAPKGATGWGVRALDAWVRTMAEEG